MPDLKIMVPFVPSFELNCALLPNITASPETMPSPVWIWPPSAVKRTCASRPSTETTWKNALWPFSLEKPLQLPTSLFWSVCAASLLRTACFLAVPEENSSAATEFSSSAV